MVSHAIRFSVENIQRNEKKKRIKIQKSNKNNENVYHDKTNRINENSDQTNETTRIKLNVICLNLVNDGVCFNTPNVLFKL